MLFKKILVYALIILVSNALFLFSPRLDNKTPFTQCSYNYIRINKYIGFQVNCDAASFIGSAIHPKYLFQQNFIRQSRPGYIILGSLVGYSFFYVSTPLHSYLNDVLKNNLPNEISKNESEKPALYACVYAGYILINLAVLVLSLLLFEKIVVTLSGSWKNGRLLFIMILVAISANQLNKYLFWTAHLQMFNILAPILCIYAGLLVKRKKENFKKIIFLSFISGCMILIYGAFLLLLPTILFSYLFTFPKSRLDKRFHSFLKAIAIIVIFFIPTISWILILKTQGVTFYSSELKEFRQFVWLVDSMKQSGYFFLKTFFENTITFLKTFSSLLLPAILLLIAFGYQKKMVGPKVKIRFPETGILRFILFIFFTFFWLLGYYADRLTTALSVILFIFFTLLINQQKINNKLKYLHLSIIIFWHFYIVVFDVPHFSNNYFK